MIDKAFHQHAGHRFYYRKKKTAQTGQDPRFNNDLIKSFKSLFVCLNPVQPEFSLTNRASQKF